MRGISGCGDGGNLSVDDLLIAISLNSEPIGFFF